MMREERFREAQADAAYNLHLLQEHQQAVDTTRKMLIHRILAVAPVWAHTLLVFTSSAGQNVRYCY